MTPKFYIVILCFLFSVKLAYAEVIDVNNEQIIELSKKDIPIIDIRRSSEWEQTGIVPESILLTFFDKNGKYNFNEWYSKLSLKVEKGKPIILICRTGRRTRIIAQMIDKKLDFKIYNSKNGITSWIDAKLPTVKPVY